MATPAMRRCLLLAVLVMIPVAARAAASASAEMSFGTPTRFAVIRDVERNRQRLFGAGDALLDPADPHQLRIVQRIELQRVRIRDRRTSRDTWVGRGASIPGGQHRQYAETVVLQGIDYQYVGVLAPRDPEASLVRIQDGRATLVIEVPPTPAAALAAVHITETAPHTYTLSRAELQTALNEGGRQVLQARPEIVPDFSVHDGLGLQVNTPLAAGRLSAQGFEVSDPRLAGRAGLEVGDVILAINGQAVNSPGDLYRLYREVQHAPLTDMAVSLERHGVALTKVYRVR